MNRSITGSMSQMHLEEFVSIYFGFEHLVDLIKLITGAANDLTTAKLICSHILPVMSSIKSVSAPGPPLNKLVFCSVCIEYNIDFPVLQPLSLSVINYL